MTRMTLYEGEYVTLRGGAPSLYSMGVSLGRQVRWNGHYRDSRFFSVLCHSAAVSDLCRPRLKLRGFIHDVTEVLASDVPSPMKTKVARKREQIIMRNICAVYGLKWPISHKDEKEIKKIDNLVTAAEAHVLDHPAANEDYPDPDIEAIKVVKKYARMGDALLDPDVAGPFFIQRFNKLAKAHFT